MMTLWAKINGTWTNIETSDDTAMLNAMRQGYDQAEWPTVILPRTHRPSN